MKFASRRLRGARLIQRLALLTLLAATAVVAAPWPAPVISAASAQSSPVLFDDEQRWRDTVYDETQRLHNRMSRLQERFARLSQAVVWAAGSISAAIVVGAIVLRWRHNSTNSRTHAPSAPDSRPYPLVAGLASVFIALMSLIVGFGVLEVASRHLVTTRTPFEMTALVADQRYPKPYVMFGGRPGPYNAGQDINSLGYRGNAPAADKPPGEIRVFFLGGSTVWEGQPPISDLVERLFEEAGERRVRAYNFGVVSSVSGMDLARLVFEVANYAPDAIIMYNGANDILHPLGGDGRPGFPFNFVVWEANPLLESDIERYPTLAMTAFGSNLLRYYFPNYFRQTFETAAAARRVPGLEPRSEQWKAAISRTYVENLVKAAAVSRGFGAEFLGFLQPMLAYKSPISAQEAALAATLTPGVRDHSLEMRQRIQRDIAIIAQPARVPVFDLSAAYDGIADTVYMDEIHTRQDAKPRIAGLIHAELRQALASRLAQTPPR